jgi:uncharacterized protein (TIGR00369 family)
VTSTSARTQSIHELFTHIGFRDYRNVDGDLVVELPVAPHVVNTNGGLQGGLLATLVDIAAGRLAIADLPPDISVVTSDLSIRYLRPIKAGAARATARVAYSGKRSMVMQVEIVGLPDETLCAIATVSFTKIYRGADHSNGTGTENE